MKKIYIIAAIMAVITGFIVYEFASQLQELSRKSVTELVDVVVATNDIPQNSVISESMVAVQKIPVDVAMKNSVNSLKLVIGQIALFPFVKGEQIIGSQIALQGDDKIGRLSIELPPGKQAISIAADNVVGVSGYIKSGDYVDIIESIAVKSVPVTRRVAEKLLVLRVGVNGTQANGEGTTITLAVSPQQAIDITHATVNGVIRTVLNPISGDKKVQNDGKA